MHYLTLIYFLAVLAFSDGSSSFAKDVAATVSKPVKVVFLGDSITAGYGIEKEQAFPYLLAQHFAKAGFPIEPVDAGITGSTSASGPGRIKWLLRSKPELLILELGANDALRGQKLSQTKGNLEKTIDLAQRADVPVLLIGMEIPRNYGETYANEFAQIYPDLAKQKGVYFAPFFKEFLDDKSLMQSDGAHPNIKGHQVIARKASAHPSSPYRRTSTATTGEQRLARHASTHVDHNPSSEDKQAGAFRLILEIKDLHKTYTQAGTTINVLSGLNLAVDAGETVAIVGQSGSGKSTLLSLMAGLDTPSSGSISVAKKNLGSLSEQELARYRALHLGIVFQQFHLISSLTAVENVSLPLQIAGDNEAGQKAHLALEKVGLSKRLTHFPSQLSGGEQQRVAIARAFVVSPSVMLADEPSGNLDAQTGTRIMDLIFSMSEAKETTLILVTHNEELAQRCSRTLCLKQGQLKDVR